MGRNFDYPMPLEGRMAKSYLWAIEKDARELRQLLRDDDDLPGWVQAKIVTAQDRISVVNRYMGHKIARAEGKAKNNPMGESVGKAGTLFMPVLTITAFLFAAGFAADKLAERRRGARLR
jgi:hypothetical protein